MSTFSSPPFHEFEERFLLAEILKSSLVHPGAILRFTLEAGITNPAWFDIALPQGRSISACQQAYDALVRRTNPTAQNDKGFKRPYSAGEPLAPVAPGVREIQPRLSFATVNDPSQISPSSGNDRPRKKRGRPSKVEHERRVAEALERGEVYPKPRKRKTPRASTEGGAMEGVAIEGAETVGGSYQAPGVEGTLAGEGGEGAGARPPEGPAPAAVMFTPTRCSPPLASDMSTSSSSKKKKWLAGASAQILEPAPASASVGLSSGRIAHEEQRVAGGNLATEAPRPDAQTNVDLLVAGLRQHNSMQDGSTENQMGQSESTANTGQTLYGANEHMFHTYRVEEQQ